MLDKKQSRFVHGREVEFMAEAHGWVMVRNAAFGPPYTMLLTEWMKFPDLETGRKYWAEFHKAVFARDPQPEPRE